MPKSTYHKISTAMIAGAFSVVPTLTSAMECVNFDNRQGSEFERITIQNEDVTIKLLQGEFTMPDGRLVDGAARYQRSNAECNDNGLALLMNKANLNIYIEPLSAPVTSIVVFYCDFGGHNNISGQVDPIGYIGTVIDVNGKQLPGPVDSLNMQFNWFSKTNWGSRGELVANSSDAREFVIGGEELYIGEICFNY